MQSDETSPSPVPCNVYIDAENIRIHLQKAGLSGYFDPRKLLTYLEAQMLGGRPIVPLRTFFYDTVCHDCSEDTRHRQQQYLEKVEQLPDTHVVTGYIGTRGKQKETDVQLAVDALEGAWSGKVGAICIASGDGDFTPVAEAVRRIGPLVLVLAFKSALSPELRDAADRVILLADKPASWAMQF